MRTMQDVLAKMKQCHAAIVEAYEKRDAATDATEKAGYDTFAKGKTAELNALQNECDELEALEKIEAKMKTASVNAQPVNAPNLNPEVPKAKAFTGIAPDPKADARAKDTSFWKYVAQGKDAFAATEGVAFESILVKSDKIRASNPLAVALPAHLADVVSGKTTLTPMLSTDTTGGVTDSGAGLTIPPNYVNELLKMQAYIPTLADRARRVPAMGGRWEYPMLDQSGNEFGGVAWSTVTEGEQGVEQKPVFKTFSGSTHLVMGLAAMSRMVLSRSGLDLQTEVTTLFRDSFGHFLSKMILVGNGTTEPEGIITCATLNTVARAVASQVAQADVTNLEYAVKKGVRAGAIYVIADGVEKYLATLKDSTGRRLGIPLMSSDLSGGMVKNRVNGYDYDVHEYTSPALGDPGDVIFGSLNNYALGIEQEMAIDRSDHFLFDTAGVVFRLIALVGGKVIQPKAFAKLINAA